MLSFEQALRKLTAKLTGRELSEVPGGEMERVIGFMAEHAPATGEGSQGPQGEKGEKGDTGPAGASLTAIALTVDEDGAVTGGTATLSDSSTIPITATTGE